MKTYYSTQEIAAICHVSRGSVFRWIREGKLPASTTGGGHHRVIREDLIHFVKSLKMPLPEELLPVVKNPVVLIVDDDMAICGFLKNFLQNNFPEIRIEQAHDGFEAGQAAAKLNPALILLDIHLPGIDGYQVCRSLKNGGNSKIIGISGFINSEAEQKALEAGADDFLAKPFDIKDLKKSIEKNLGEKNEKFQRNAA